MSSVDDNSPSMDLKRETNASGDAFKIAGIGASAGGLEALEDFFDALPADTGMAFVVVQHLSPDFKSHMAQLLGRHTDMPIHRVDNGMLVEPNTVYLIPAKMEMVISEQRLLLTEKGSDRSLSHPIDQFLTSLAGDVGNRSCGVILSGTGSDGSRGIRDIHEAGGLVLVQDEQSAKFDGMPLNAQATGVADLILSPSGLASALARYASGTAQANAFGLDNQVPSSAEGIDRIFELLNHQHGLDFSNYKSSTVGRRIQRRIDLLRLPTLEDYLQNLEKDPVELNYLYKDLLIGVTKFFRDPEAFESLQKTAVANIFKKLDPGKAIRVWVAGCATGEEAYSIAMLFDEELQRRQLTNELKIFATDAHHVSLNAAARGVFPEESLSQLSVQRRATYFRKQRDGFHVTRDLRRYIVFAPHNLLVDAPFTQMDLVTCRNLLIYLRPAAQQKAFSLIHFALKANGSLFLGPSETTGELSDEFEALDQRWKIYRKARDVRLPISPRLPMSMAGNRMANSFLSSQRKSRSDAESSLLRTYDLLLNRKMPTSILIDDQADILHIFGDAQKYLKPRTGRPDNNLLHQVLDPLKQLLSGAVHQALRKHQSVHYSGIRLTDLPAEQILELVVEPLDDPQSTETRLLVEFHSKSQTGPADPHIVASDPIAIYPDAAQTQRVSTLEAELQSSQENLQATVEEMETSNEELQATNEELVASNEELQSTNEELHSVNEELYSVNAEHQQRLEELARANDDMDNLLATTRVGVIFLDNNLSIRRFTPEITRLFDLVPQDIGRSIEGFAYHLSGRNLIDDLKEVVSSQLEREVEVEGHGGAPFLVRILPYRSGNESSGVVMTLVDIQSVKNTQADLERFKYMTESAQDAISWLNRDGEFTYVNSAMCKALGFSKDQLLQMQFFDVNVEFTFDEFNSLFEHGDEHEIPTIESEWQCSDGSLLPVEMSISCVDFVGDRFLCLNVRNISERRNFEREMKLQHLAIESAQNGIVIADATADDMPITYANPGFLSLTGYTSEEVIGQNCRFLQGNLTDSKTTEMIRQAISDGEPCEVTLLNYRKDGSTFWNDLHLTPVFDSNGALKNFVGVQHDISERIAVEVAAKRNAERTQTILDSTAEGIYGVDQDDVCIFCNRAAVSLLGYSSEDELIGRHMHELIHHSKSDGTPLALEDCPIYITSTKAENSHVDQDVFWRKDGSCLKVEYWSRPLLRDGELKGAVVTFQDISEQLAITSRLEQMGMMIDAAYDAIIASKLDGGILSWNTGATHLYGFSGEEAVGEMTRELFDTRHSEPWDSVRKSLLETGQWTGTMNQRVRDGRRITVSTRHQLLRLPNGDMHVLEINRDITEQMRTQEKLERANRAALRASDAKTAFIANISHELRTPITAMLGFADILSLDAVDDEQAEKLNTIKRNGEYLLALLNDILDLSKVEAGKMEVENISINVVELLRDIRSLVSIRSAEEGIPLHFELEPGLPQFITADTTRVRQILVNLISNALKFTDEGEVRVHVRLLKSNSTHKPASLCFEIHDTGIGMTAEQQQQLFKPFSQATPDTAKKYGGTGLGLSISRRLAEQMGGTILVRSEYQKGSCFTLSLPVTKEQMTITAEAGALSTSEKNNRKEKPSLPKFDARILLADDRRDVWRVGRFFLEKCGATVTIAEDGRQAIDAATRAREAGEPFSLILMDMQMPVMDGREAVTELRKQGFTVPIIALTAHAMEGEREACLNLGCTEYFSKPIDGRRLMNLVHDLLKENETLDGDVS